MGFVGVGGEGGGEGGVSGGGGWVGVGCGEKLKLEVVEVAVIGWWRRLEGGSGCGSRRSQGGPSGCSTAEIGVAGRARA